MNILAFLGGIGLSEVLVIALVVLLFFGGKKIPELMKGLGKGVRSFKDGMKEVENDVKIEKEESRNSIPILTEWNCCTRKARSRVAKGTGC